jgi:hypothetical protein
MTLQIIGLQLNGKRATKAFLTNVTADRSGRRRRRRCERIFLGVHPPFPDDRDRQRLGPQHLRHHDAFRLA